MPSQIKKLKDHEVFVFGSNMNGEHSAGAAKQALDSFGAVNGKSEGLYGQSYAFPTLDKNMNKRSINNLKQSVDRLIICANKHRTKTFLLTKVGCGIAGFDENEMKQLFDRPDMPANIIKPVGW